MRTLAHEPHTQCLRLIQKAMADPVKKSNAHMIFGEVSKGAGGSVMLSAARRVLEVEFPELTRIQLHIAYEFNVAGQCIAAAALPFWADTSPEAKKSDVFREAKTDV